METEKLLGIKHTVDSLEEAVIILEFTRKHLEDIGHHLTAGEVGKVRSYLARLSKEKQEK